MLSRVGSILHHHKHKPNKRNLVFIDEIRIINYESQLFEVKIYDIKGKNIFTKKYNDILNNIDLAFLANGFYYLNIKILL